MLKIAVLADLHLPDELPSMHVKVLQDAIGCCIEEKADVIVCAGDMAKAEAFNAAKFLLDSLRAAQTPLVITQGNTEQGIPGFDRMIADYGKFISPEVEIFNAETPLPDTRSAKLRILAGHWPLKELPANVDMQIAGHSHIDRSENGIEVVRGLDPDKVIGGAPAVTFFTVSGNNCQRTEKVLPGFSVSEWSRRERAGLLGQIGVSVKYDAVQELSRAVELNIPAVEILHTLTRIDTTAQAAKNYREQTGGVISVHLPDISFANPDAAAEAVKRGIDIGAEQFTLHVPKATLAELATPADFERMTDLFCNVLELAPQAVFGIENMHLVKNETEFERRFGYTPFEQLKMIQTLRDRLPQHKIGALLDIGHARNNGVFYRQHSLAQWYDALRGNIVGMHLHQVTSDAEGYHNHTPITGWYQRLISLASFINEWRNGCFAGAKLFIECRGGWESTYTMFKQELSK